MMRNQPSERRGRGQTLVEFALLLPLLLLLLFGIIDFGIAVFRYNTVANVGREVARRGVVRPDCDELDDFVYADKDAGAYSDEIRRWTTAMVTDTDTFTITYAFTPGDILSSTVHVTVTYNHELLTGPIIQAVGGDREITMRTMSSMRTERPADYDEYTVCP
ncbi:MAG: TadE/TadG family type IV pilus assembly protein [Anaerolineae bacterium]